MEKEQYIKLREEIDKLQDEMISMITVCEKKFLDLEMALHNAFYRRKELPIEELKEEKE